MEFGLFQRLGIDGLSERARVEKDNAVLQFFLGLALYQAGNFPAAERAFCEAIAKGGISKGVPAQVYLYRAKSILNQVKEREAFEALREATYFLQAQEGHSEACAIAGELACQFGLVDDAFKFFREGLRVNASEARHQFGMCRLFESGVSDPRFANLKLPDSSQSLLFRGPSVAWGRCWGRTFRTAESERLVALISADEDRKGVSASLHVEMALSAFRGMHFPGRENVESYLYCAKSYPTIVRVDGVSDRDSVASFSVFSFEEFEKLTGFRLRWTAEQLA